MVHSPGEVVKVIPTMQQICQQEVHLIGCMQQFHGTGWAKDMAKSRKSKREKKEGICVYCGKINQLSEDHVIPQCLFPGKCPSDTPRVYACEKCNGVIKSEYDVYLRDMLFLDTFNSHHAAVRQLWSKFERSLERRQSPMAKEGFTSSQLVRLHTSSGIFREWAYEIKLPRERVNRMFSLIIRGLYQYYVGRRLPQDSQFELGRILSNLEPFEATVNMLYQKGAPLISVGDGEVFKCIFAYATEQPEVSLWFLCFYRSVVFTVVTNRSKLQTA